MRSSVDVSVLEGRTEVPRASGDFASRPSRTGLYVSGGHLPTAEGPSATGSAATAGPEARTCSGMATLASLAAAQAPLPPQPRLSIPELGRPQEVIPTTNNDFLSNWEALAAITAAPPPMLQPPSPLMPSPPPLSPLWDFGFMPPPVGRLSPAEFVLDFNDAWEINLGRALPPPLTRAFDSVFLRTSALARKEIDALPSFVFSEPQASSPHSIASPASCFPACVIPETSCAVCQCDYEPGETLRSLSCGGGKARHAFHRDCIDQWLVLHATCPVCRARVVSTAPAATADGATVAAGAGGAVAAAGGGGAAAAAGGSGEAAAAGAAAPPPPVVLSSQGPTIVAELTSRTGRVRRHASGSGPVLLRAGSPSASPAGLLEHGPRGWNTWADADGTMPQPTGFVTRLVFVIDSPQYPAIEWTSDGRQFTVDVTLFASPGGGLSAVCDTGFIGHFYMLLRRYNIRRCNFTERGHCYRHPHLFRSAAPEVIALISTERRHRLTMGRQMGGARAAADAAAASADEDETPPSEATT